MPQCSFGLCILVARSLEDDMQSSHTHSSFQPLLIAEVIVKWIQFRVSGHTGDPVVLKPLVCMVTGYSVSQMSDKDSAYWQSASHLFVMPLIYRHFGTQGRRKESWQSRTQMLFYVLLKPAEQIGWVFFLLVYINCTT